MIVTIPPFEASSKNTREHVLVLSNAWHKVLVPLLALLSLFLLGTGQAQAACSAPDNGVAWVEIDITDTENAGWGVGCSGPGGFGCNTSPYSCKGYSGTGDRYLTDCQNGGAAGQGTYWLDGSKPGYTCTSNSVTRGPNNPGGGDNCQVIELNLDCVPDCALTVNMSATPLTQVSGQPVAFTATPAATNCTGISTPTYSWSFGDSTGSSLQNPSHVYNTTFNRTYTATVTVSQYGKTASASRVITVTPPPCSYTLGSTSANIVAGGGTGSFPVTSGSGCAWTATESFDWVTITSGASGTGNGTVSYSVAANSGAARSGFIVLGGGTAPIFFSINQAAAPTLCTYTLNSTSAIVAAAGSTGSFGITSALTCDWIAESKVSWITDVTGSGTGNGTISYSVKENIGAARTGTITVGDKIFTVNQLAPATICPTTVSPESYSQPAGQNSGTIQFQGEHNPIPWSFCSTLLVITDSATDGCLSGSTQAEIDSCPLSSKVRYRLSVPTTENGTTQSANVAVNYVLTSASLSGQIAGDHNTVVQLNPNTTYYWKMGAAQNGANSNGSYCTLDGVNGTNGWQSFINSNPPKCNDRQSFTTGPITNANTNGGTPFATISATDCVISANASTCNSTVTWNTTNTGGRTTFTVPPDMSFVGEVNRFQYFAGNPPAVQISLNTSGTVVNPVPYGSYGFNVYYNGAPINSLSEGNMEATCATGTTWDGSKCSSSGNSNSSTCSIAVSANGSPLTGPAVLTVGLNANATATNCGGWIFRDGGSVGGINYGANKAAAEPRFVTFNNELYALWAERDTISNYDIRVKKYMPLLQRFGEPLVTTLDDVKARDAESPAPAVVGSNVYVAWAEDNTNGIKKIKVKRFTPPDWSGTLVGKGMIANNNNPETNPSAIEYQGKLYVTWEEMVSGVSQVRVKMYDPATNAWIWPAGLDTGGVNGINRAINTPAKDPVMAVWSSSTPQLYISWMEGTPPTSGLIHVKMFDGTNSSFKDNGGLNYDKNKYAEKPFLLADDQDLYAAWEESPGGANKQIRVKQYNPRTNSWSFIDGGGATGINYDTSLKAQGAKMFWSGDAGTKFPGDFNVGWEEGAPTGATPVSRSRVRRHIGGSTWSPASPSADTFDRGGLNYLPKDSRDNGAGLADLIIIDSKLWAAFTQRFDGSVPQVRVREYTLSPDLAYSWNFGDATPAVDSQNVSHSYNAEGNFTATVTASIGSDQATATVPISVGTGTTCELSVTAAATPNQGAAPLAVALTSTPAYTAGCSPVLPLTYSWAFGDSGTAAEQNPNHTFSVSGSYNPTVTVTMNDSLLGVKTATASVPVSVGSLSGWKGNIYNSAYGQDIGWVMFGQPTAGGPWDGVYQGVTIADTSSGPGRYNMSGEAYSTRYGLIDFTNTSVKVEGSWGVMQGSATLPSSSATLKLASGPANGINCSKDLDAAPSSTNYGVCIDLGTGFMYGYAWSDVYGWLHFAGKESGIGASPLVDSAAKDAGADYQVTTDVSFIGGNWTGNVHNSAFGIDTGWIMFSKWADTSPYKGLYNGVYITDAKDINGKFPVTGNAMSEHYGPVDFTGTFVTDLVSGWGVFEGNAAFTSTAPSATLTLSNGTPPCSVYLTDITNGTTSVPALANYGVCIAPNTGYMYGYAHSPEYGWVKFSGKETGIGSAPVPDDDAVTGMAYQVVTDWKGIIIPTVEVLGCPEGTWANDTEVSVECTEGTGEACPDQVYKLKLSNTNPGDCSLIGYDNYDTDAPHTINSPLWICGTGKDQAGTPGYSVPVFCQVDKDPPVINSNGNIDDFLPPSGDYREPVKIRITDQTFTDAGSGMNSVHLIHLNSYEEGMGNANLNSITDDCDFGYSINCKEPLVPSYPMTAEKTHLIADSNSYAVVAYDNANNMLSILRRYRVLLLNPIIYNVEIGPADQASSLVISGRNFGSSGKVHFYRADRITEVNPSKPYSASDGTKITVNVNLTDVRFLRVEKLTGQDTIGEYSDYYNLNQSSSGSGGFKLTPTYLSVFPGDEFVLTATKGGEDTQTLKYKWTYDKNIFTNLSTAGENQPGNNRLVLRVNTGATLGSISSITVEIMDNEESTPVLEAKVRIGEEASSSKYMNIDYLPGISIIDDTSEKSPLLEGPDIYLGEDPIGWMKVMADVSESYEGCIDITYGTDSASAGTLHFKYNQANHAYAQVSYCGTGGSPAGGVLGDDLIEFTPPDFPSTVISIQPRVSSPSQLTGLYRLRIGFFPKDMDAPTVETLLTPLEVDSELVSTCNNNTTPFTYVTTLYCHQVGTVVCDEHNNLTVLVVGDCPVTADDAGPIGIRNGYQVPAPNTNSIESAEEIKKLQKLLQYDAGSP